MKKRSVVAAAGVLLVLSSCDLFLGEDKDSESDNSDAGSPIAAAGVLDTGFGSGGYVQLAGLAVYAAAEDSSGALFAAGENTGEPGLGKVVKVSGSGALAASFGSGGIAQLDLPGTGAVYVRALHVLSDGSVLVAGDFDDTQSDPQSRDLFIAKLTASGTLSSQFGTIDGESLSGGGLSYYSTSLNEYAYAMTVKPNGMIVVAYQQDDNLHVSLAAFQSNGLPAYNAFDMVEGGGNDSQTMTIQYGGTSAEYTATGLDYADGGFWLSFLRKEDGSHEPTLVRLSDNGRFDVSYFEGTGRTIAPYGMYDQTYEPLFNRRDSELWIAVQASDTGDPENQYVSVSSWSSSGTPREVFGTEGGEELFEVGHESESLFAMGIAGLGSGRSAVLLKDDGPSGSPGTPRAWVSFHASSGARDASRGTEGITWLSSESIALQHAAGIRLLSSGKLLVWGSGTDSWLARIK